MAVDHYRSSIPNLSTPVADAELLAQILRDFHGFETEIITNQKVTAKGLRKTFRRLADRVEETDRVIFYFAGHGTAFDSDSGPQGYILPHDADSRSKHNHFGMEELDQSLARLRCRHMLVVLDCCFAGALRWSSTRHLTLAPENLHDERFNWYVESPAWQAIASASHDQQAMDVSSSGPLGKRGDDHHHSPFARALIDGLLGKADISSVGGKGDGVITATELYIYIDQCLQRTSRRNHKQTPLLWPLKKHENGQFVFLVPGTELSLPPAPRLDQTDNPWRGLQPYEVSDGDIFFGRTSTADRLTQLILAPEAGDPASFNRLIVVAGPSGIGKSSLMKAGVLPKLREAGVDVLLFRPSTAGYGAFKNLAASIALHSALDGPSENDLRTDIDALTQWIGWQDSTCRFVLVVDQAEELIATDDDKENGLYNFVDLIAHTLKNVDVRLRCVFTVRSDFEPRFAETKLSELWLKARFLVPQMTQDEIRRVIEGPAARKVIRFESEELVETLVNETVGMPGGLPLLSFALSQMFRNYIDRLAQDRTLSTKDYAALGGGVIGSLRVRANQIVSEGDAEQKQTARRVLERFVSLEGGQFTRRKVALAEFEIADREELNRTRKILKCLTDERLIVSDSAQLHAKRETKPLDIGANLELAHDALISSWDQLYRWVIEDTATTKNLRRLTRDSFDWRAEGGKGAARLWDDGEQAAVLRKLSRTQHITLSITESGFLAASLLRHRHKTCLAVAGYLLLLGALVAPGYVWFNYFRISTSYCADYVVRWERAECVSDIPVNDLPGRSLTYRLIRKGQVPIEFSKIDAYGRPTTGQRSDLDVDGDWLEDVETVKYESIDGNGHPTRLTYFGANGVTIRRVSYDFENDGSTAVAVFNESLGVSYYQEAAGSSLSQAEDNDRRARIGQHRLEFNQAGFVVRRTFHPTGSLDPIRDSSGSYGQNYARDPVGHAITIDNCDAGGSTLVDKTGISSITRRLNENGQLVELQWRDLNGKPAPNALGFSTVFLDYDLHGNIIEERSTDAAGHLLQRRDTGIAETRIVRNQKGLEIERNHFDGLAHAALDKELGYFKRVKVYDLRGHLAREAYFDVSGMPVLRKDNGTAAISVVEDEVGNRVEVNYFGTLGERILRSDYGFATKTAVYDAHSRLIEEAYFGLDGKRTLDTVGGVARVAWTHDERGNEVAAAYYGVDNGPILRKGEGIARKAVQFDRHGNHVGENYFSVDGKPVVRKDRGFASWVATFDERGNQVEGKYFDVGGHLVIDKITHCASFRRQYDDRGNRIVEEFFGTEMQPIVLKELGYFRRIADFDVRGNEIEERYFGVDGKPILGLLEGVSGVLRKFDSRGNEINTLYIGTNDEPLASKFGYAHERHDFDEQGNEIVAATYDAEGNPIVDNEMGIFEIATRYSAMNELLEARYFDTNGSPALRKDKGFAQIKFKYDRVGKITEEAYFGLRGEPVLAKISGVAKKVYTIDARGDRIREEAFGVDGLPILQVDSGISSMKIIFDDFGRDIEESYFDVDGKPILDTEAGVATIKSRYDYRGNEVEIAYFDVDGDPILERRGFAASKAEFDEQDNKVYEQFFGVDRKPILRSDNGIASWRISFDDRGNEIGTRFFDDHDGPVIDKMFGAAGVINRYDECSRLVGMDFLGTSGQPVVALIGVASFTEKLDEFGRTTEERYYGIDGKIAVDREKGVAGVSYEYDIRGNRITARYFDILGFPTVRQDKGYASSHNSFDARYNKTEEFYQGLAKKLVADASSGVARYVWTYDSLGNVASEEYFGADNLPILHKTSRVSLIRYSRDKAYQVIEEAYFGLEGRPKLSVLGFSVKSLNYDARHRKISERYFSTDGSQTRSLAHGAAELVWNYDDADRVVSIEYFDEKGNSIKGKP